MRSLPKKRLLRRVSQSATYLKNGRINCRITARSLDIGPEELTDFWASVATDLGFGREFLGFWRRRLVEALLGLAADPLRDSGAVAVHGEDRRRRPDPRGRLERIRKLRARLGCRPMPRDLKSVLARYQNCDSRLCPRAILADANRLEPDHESNHGMSKPWKTSSIA